LKALPQVLFEHILITLEQIKV